MSDKSMNSFLLGNGCILLATIFWGINVPATKALIPDFMTAEGISVVRLVGGAILFLGHIPVFQMRKIKGGTGCALFWAAWWGFSAFIYILSFPCAMEAPSTLRS